MATAEDDLRGFSDFVHQRLQADDSVSLTELMDEWQLLHPKDTQFAENVDAVNAAIADYKNGDRGKLAGELTRELRESLRKSME